MSRKRLSGNNKEREDELLRWIGQSIKKNHISPTIREIRDGFIHGGYRFTSTSVVNYYLRKLMNRGLLGQVARISRSIRLTADGNRLVNPSSAQELSRQIRDIFDELADLDIIQARVLALEIYEKYALPTVLSRPRHKVRVKVK